MIICLGREFGSGGHEVGKLLAEKFSISLYDQELVTAAMERCGDIDPSEMEKADEKKAKPWLYGVLYGSNEAELRGLSASEITFELQCRVILEMAQKGDCVFVGRCADYILARAGVPHVSVFVTAPFSERVARKMKLLHIDEKGAAALVRKTDKQRKNYYNYYTGGNWGKTSNYDFCINSHNMDLEKVAEIIADVALKYK